MALYISERGSDGALIMYAQLARREEGAVPLTIHIAPSCFTPELPFNVQARGAGGTGSKMSPCEFPSRTYASGRGLWRGAWREGSQTAVWKLHVCGEMSKASPWGSPTRAPACMETQLGAVRYRRDGALLLSASSLNSRTWGGSIWVFKDPAAAPNESLCAAGVQTETGVADVAWVLERGILVASDSGAVELWELLDNESLLVNKFTRYEHDDIVTSVSVFSGGTLAVSGSKDFSVQIWDLSQKTPLKSYNAHSSQVNCVSTCPGKEAIFLSCGEDNRVLLWDTRNPKPAKRINVCAPNVSPTYVTWHPNKDDIFACGDEIGNVYVVNLSNPESAQAVAAHSRSVTGLAYSNHSSPLLASISEDCSVVVLNAESSEIFKDHSHKDFVTGVAWSPTDLSSFTTVGWDHKVLHHSLPKEDKPEPPAETQD